MAPERVQRDESTRTTGYINASVCLSPLPLLRMVAVILCLGVVCFMDQYNGIFHYVMARGDGGCCVM